MTRFVGFLATWWLLLLRFDFELWSREFWIAGMASMAIGYLISLALEPKK